MKKRQLNFILCAKGGVGKSILSYLFAIAKEKEAECLFIDTDNSTQTSKKQLRFLGNDRVELLSLLNNNEVLVRDNLVSYLESLVDSPFTQFYFDLGSPESEQMPAFIERDLPLKEFLDELGFEAHFHIVIGGGGAYKPSIEYMLKLLKVLGGQFEITIWQSITSFKNFPELSSELKHNCDKLQLHLQKFGDFDPSTLLGSQILDFIRKGAGLSEYSAGARLRLIKELKENFGYEK